MEKLNSELMKKLEDLMSINNALKHQNKIYLMNIENIDQALNDLRFELFSCQLEFKIKISYFRDKTLELLEYIDSYDNKNINISNIEEIKQEELPKRENEELKKQLELKDNQINRLKKDLNDKSTKFIIILENHRFLTKFDNSNNSVHKEKVIMEIEKFKNSIENKDLDSIKNKIESMKINESDQKVLNLKILLKNSSFQLKKELSKTKIYGQARIKNTVSPNEKKFIMTENENIKLRERSSKSNIQKLDKAFESIAPSNEDFLKVKAELRQIEKKNFTKKQSTKNLFDPLTIKKVKQYKHKKIKSKYLSQIRKNGILPEQEKTPKHTTSFIKSETNKLTGFVFDPFKKQINFFGSYPDTIFRFEGMKKNNKKGPFRKIFKKIF